MSLAPSLSQRCRPGKFTVAVRLAIRVISPPERNPIMVRIFCLALALIAAMTHTVLAQDPFFKGKTVRIIVPFAAGGGYDIYSRIMGRHMGKYIPGNPVLDRKSVCREGG